MKNYEDLQSSILKAVNTRYCIDDYNSLKKRYMKVCSSLTDLKKELEQNTKELKIEQCRIREALLRVQVDFATKSNALKKEYTSLHTKMMEAKELPKFEGGLVEPTLYSDVDVDGFGLYAIGETVSYRGELYLVMDAYWSADKALEEAQYLYRLRKIASKAEMNGECPKIIIVGHDKIMAEKEEL